MGIWHETYLVPAGAYDSVYNNMPPVGLGAVTKLVPAAGRRATAAGRAGIRDEPYPDGRSHRAHRRLNAWLFPRAPRS